MPIQHNSYDYGVFVYMYAHYLAASSPFSFNQGDMPDKKKTYWIYDAWNIVENIHIYSYTVWYIVTHMIIIIL